MVCDLVEHRGGDVYHFKTAVAAEEAVLGESQQGHDGVHSSVYADHIHHVSQLGCYWVIGLISSCGLLLYF